MTKNLLVFLSAINVYACINTTINVIYHPCFCNRAVNKWNLQNILIRMVYLQQYFVLLTIIACLWAKILRLALTFCLKVHSNLGMQGINILMVYIRKDWKHFFLMKSVLLFIHHLLFGCQTANFGQLARAQFHSVNLNYSVYANFQAKRHWEPPNKTGSLNPAKHLVEFELGTFWFNHNTLTHLTCTVTMHDISIYPSYLNVIYWSRWSKSRDLVQLLSSWGWTGSKKFSICMCTWCYTKWRWDLKMIESTSLG